MTKNRGPHTFLYRALAEQVRRSSTAVFAITSVPSAVSFSAWLGAVGKNTQLADLLRQTSLIIWDEVSMQHKHCFEALHRMLTDVRGDEYMFGGIPTVFGGDFAQIRMDL